MSRTKERPYYIGRDLSRITPREMLINTYERLAAIRGWTPEDRIAHAELCAVEYGLTKRGT